MASHQSAILSASPGLGAVGYALLFVPYLASLGASGSPGTSYMIAWSGSWFILWMTLSGKVKPLPTDRPFRHQILRPIIFTQLVFVGYNCLTSIFYFADLNGFYYLSRSPFAIVDERSITLAAKAQQYYVLAHAALATGMLAGMDYRRSGEWQVKTKIDVPRLMLLIAGAGFVVGQAMSFLPGMGQLEERFQAVALVASVLALAAAIPTRRFSAVLIAGAIYGANLLAAFRSGWKEEVLVMVLLLAVFAYPYHKKLVLIGSPIVLAALLFILPTYSNIVRSLSWVGSMSGAEAASIATDAIRSGDVDFSANNWTFLTGRFSEIGLFVKYLESVPAHQPFYGGQLAAQAGMSLVPRALWSSKPITEYLVMERVYENGVVDRASNVSAKPQYIVDGYLSGGAFGVIVACFIYGLLAAVASRVAERLFGGYLFGTALVYTAFFSSLWRGNSFEFLFNNIVWSFIIMVVVFYAARSAGWITRKAHSGLVVPSPAIRPVWVN